MWRCWKNRRKGKKEAANDWPKAGRDEPRDYRHRTAKQKSDEILVPTRLTKGGRLELDDHEGLKQGRGCTKRNSEPDNESCHCRSPR
jgi:hypothetical protein